MAGRIRSIKPETLSDGKAARLSDRAWRLWVSMWTLADDCGLCPADPDYLGGQVFWGQSNRDCEKALAELVRAGFVSLYQVNGERFAKINGWAKHQKIDRPSPPKFPVPAEVLASPREPSRGFDADGMGWEGDMDGKGEVEDDAAGKQPPLPFKPDAAVEALASASGGRFTASKLTKGQAINCQRLIREAPALTTWTLVGQWLTAGGDGWKGDLDVRHLRDFATWVAHAQRWDSSGRGPVNARNGSTPAVGHARPAPHNTETTEYDL